MQKRDIFDDIIDILADRQRQGSQTIYLSDETRAALFVQETNAAVKEKARSVPQSQSQRPTSRRRPASQQPRPPAERRQPAPAATASSTPRPDVQHLEWPDLKECVATCKHCDLAQSRTHVVFGEGDEKADVMFIGEGPGYHEDQSGRPFVGPSGDLLTKMIAAMQLSRDDVYIANIVKCRPPGNRNPVDSEADTCLPYLKRQIQLIQPRFLVLLGSVPLRQLLNKTGISELHGTWLEYEGIPTMPTFHPSYLLRSPQRKREAWEDLQQVMKRLGKDPQKTLEAMERRKKEARQ